MGINLLLAGCGEKEEPLIQDVSEDFQAEITLMHVDADKEEFRQFIAETEEKLQMKINVLSPPINAYNRQAKISTILSSGDSTVDVIGINDEMINEFKYQGYLEPLDSEVMPDDILKCYPQDYMQKIAMADGQVYSVPYAMDMMMFWGNEEVLKEVGIGEVADLEDFEKLLKANYKSGAYGYGSAWETTYVYNDISQFINMFGGSYEDWSDPQTREAMEFLHDMIRNQVTPGDILLDQYEQMEQKFINGKYASIFMYSGAVETFLRAGAYAEDEIHAIPLPMFKANATNVATWQYVLNRASVRKESAKKFLAYVAGKEGSIAYATAMKRLPARLDIIEHEELDIPDMEVMRAYVETLELKARPLSSNPMEEIRDMGTIFQKYVADEISLDEFCDKAQIIVDG